MRRPYRGIECFEIPGRRGIAAIGDPARMPEAEKSVPIGCPNGSSVPSPANRRNASIAAPRTPLITAITRTRLAVSQTPLANISTHSSGQMQHEPSDRRLTLTILVVP
jgi:hypothetical protein